MVTGRAKWSAQLSSIARTRHSPASVTWMALARCRSTARSTSPVKEPLLSGSSSAT
jgi:hypothetical protein